MKKIYLLFLQFALAGLSCFAQPGALDLSFDPGTGADNVIKATAIQSDGKIIAVGDFANYNGTSINRIVRILPTGLIDTAFHVTSGANAIVYAVAIQTDGKIVIAGDFTTYNGTPCNNIARLNYDGSIDGTFTIGVGPNNDIKAITIQSDGKIIAAGNFTSWSGATRNRLVRLNTDGSVDGSFNPGSGANGTVESLAMQTDGKIVIGGSFTSFGTNILLRLGRVNADGSADNGFNTFLGGASSTVIAIAVQADQHILIGGNFVNYNGSPTNRLTRLISNGSFDNTFFTGQASNSTVNAIRVTNSGEILIAGNFTSYDGTAINRIARLTSSGYLDPLFNPGTGADAEVLSISVQSDGKIIIAGAFNNYNGVGRNKIARLNACVTPQPGIISGRLITCPGTVETYSISPVSGADSYSWSLPSGWGGNSDSVSIIATSNGLGGTISVAANSIACGSSLARTVSVTPVPIPAAPVCLVTVDDLSTHNVIFWEKPHTATIDSFFIYREITTNTYSKIAAIPYDSLNEYHDYVDPNVTSHKYKISILDTCGVESAKSDYHNTIHLQPLGGGQLQWTLYGIENGANPVTYYNVYRDDFGNGNFHSIDSIIPGGNSTFTDVNFNLYDSAKYLVDVTWNISCNPYRTVNTSRSNIKRGYQATSTSIAQEFDDLVKVYPNPSHKDIIVELPNSLELLSVKIFNVLGELFNQNSLFEKDINSSKLNIDIEGYTTGIYSIQIETKTNRFVKKLVVE